jgi:hypothetical protein
MPASISGASAALASAIVSYMTKDAAARGTYFRAPARPPEREEWMCVCSADVLCEGARMRGTRVQNWLGRELSRARRGGEAVQHLEKMSGAGEHSAGLPCARVECGVCVCVVLYPANSGAFHEEATVKRWQRAANLGLRLGSLT